MNVMTNQEASDIQVSINSHEIFSLSRKDLERFVMALSTSDAHSHFNQNEFPAICETIRMALSLRVSEDSNFQAKRESRIALIISVFALVAGITQAGIALWQLICAHTK